MKIKIERYGCFWKDENNNYYYFDEENDFWVNYFSGEVYLKYEFINEDEYFIYN